MTKSDRPPTYRARVVADLSGAEREALINAAVWYAKYHEGMIDLYDALAKLGVRLHRPAGIRPAA